MKNIIDRELFCTFICIECFHRQAYNNFEFVFKPSNMYKIEQHKKNNDILFSLYICLQYLAPDFRVLASLIA